MIQYFLRNMLLAFFLFQVCLAFGQSDGIVLKEGFADNRHNWDEFNTRLRLAKVWKGKYLLNTRKNKIGLLTDIEAPLDQNNDFSIAVQITKISGFDGDGYGLCWGKKDKDNCFTFTLSGKGVYEIGKWEHGKWQYISRRESYFINKWDAANKIEINKKGSRILFLINDSLVENQPFERFFGTRIGFVVYNKMRVEISDLVLKGTSTKPKPSAISGMKRRDPKKKKNDGIEINNLHFKANNGGLGLSKLSGGAIHFQLLNPYEDPCENISIWLTCLSKTQRITFPKEFPIPSLPGNSTSDFAIPIDANNMFTESEQEIRVQLVGPYGLLASPQLINIKLKERQSSKIVIEKFAINDTSQDKSGAFTYGNGNGIPEKGETIRVSVSFRNAGDKLKDVKIKVYEEKYSPHLALEENGKEYFVGDMGQDETKQIAFNFFSSEAYSSVDIPIGIRFSEHEGGFYHEQNLGLRMNEKPQPQTQSTFFSSSPANIVSEPEIIIEPSLLHPNTFVLILGCAIDDKLQRARNDALRFYSLCRTVMGVPDENIYLECDNRFRASDLMAIISKNGWMGQKPGLDDARYIFYFSGSGDASKDISSLELLNCLNPKFARIKPDADNFYLQLEQLDAGEILVITDPAFSGIRSADELSLAENTGVIIPSGEPKFKPNNICYIASGGLINYSLTYLEKSHNLFSYFFIDKLMTNQELRNQSLKEIVAMVEKDMLRHKAYGSPLPNVQVYGNKEMRLFN